MIPLEIVRARNLLAIPLFIPCCSISEITSHMAPSNTFCVSVWVGSVDINTRASDCRLGSKNKLGTHVTGYVRDQVMFVLVNRKVGVISACYPTSQKKLRSTCHQPQRNLTFSPFSYEFSDVSDDLPAALSLHYCGLS